LDEYTETLRKLADNNIEEAIKFLFRVYDSDSKNFCIRVLGPIFSRNFIFCGSEKL
jgi:hypothetical protein